MRFTLVVIAAFMMAGCASEKAAWRAYHEAGRTRNAGVVSSPALPCDLPILTAESTLRDYLTYAALNNPGLKSSFERWRASLEEIPQVRALPDPKVSYTRYLEEVETRVGPQRNRFGVSQSLPWPGTLMLRGQVAVSDARIAGKEFQEARLSLFYRVKKACYEYGYAIRALSIMRANRELLLRFEKIAREQYRFGAKNHHDVIKAQVELAETEDRIQELESLLIPLRAEFNAALNRAPDAPVPSTPEFPEETGTIADETVFTRLTTHNPELEALDEEVQSAMDKVWLARAAYIPEFSVGVDYIETGRGSSTVDDRGKDPVLATVSCTLPLWGEWRPAGEREAHARLAAAKDARIERENSLSSRLARIIYFYRDAGRKRDLYRHTLIPKGEESVNTAEEIYRVGTGDFLTLIDAQRLLLEFRLSYERARADRAVRYAEIEMLVGGTVPPAGSEPAEVIMSGNPASERPGGGQGQASDN